MSALSRHKRLCGLTVFVVLGVALLVPSTHSPAAAAGTPSIRVARATANGTITGHAYTTQVDNVQLANGGRHTADINAQFAATVSGAVNDFMKQLQQTPSSATGPSSLQISVTSRYASAAVASVLFETYALLPGAAHGQTTHVGRIFDLGTGKVLGLTELLQQPDPTAVAALASAFFQNASTPGSCTTDPGTIQSTLQPNGTAVGLSDKGLVLGFQDQTLGPHAAGCDVAVTLPYGSLKNVLRAAFLPKSIGVVAPPPGEPPLDDCPLESVSFGNEASFTLFSVEIGGGSTITVAQNATTDHPYSVDADADLKLGGELIFGDSSKTNKLGFGASASIAAGLSLGAGLGYKAMNESNAVALTKAIKSGQDPTSDPVTSSIGSHPSKLSVDAGVWLNAGIDVSGPEGSGASVEAQASVALGYELDFDNSGSISGQAVVFSAKAGLDASGDTGKLFGVLAPGGQLDSEIDTEIGVLLTPNFELRGFETDLTATVTNGLSLSTGIDASELSKKLKGDVGSSASKSNGYTVEYATQLDTDGKPTAAAALSDLLQALLDTNGAPPPPTSRLDADAAALAPAASVRLLESNVSVQSTGSGVKLSDPLAVAYEDRATKTVQKTTVALWQPPGSTTLVPWVACQNAIDNGAQPEPTSTAPQPATTTTSTAPQPSATTTTSTAPQPSATTTTSTVPSTQPTTSRPAGPTRTVSVDGHIENLLIDTATEQDVRTALGNPDATGHGNVGVPGFPNFVALGYNCAPTQTGNWYSVNGPAGGGPFCQTVYFINTRTQRLAAFWTASADYQTTAGTRVGMTSSEAQQRDGAPVQGCDLGITLGNQSTPASVQISVGPNATDTVDSIAAESRKHDVGILFC